MCRFIAYRGEPVLLADVLFRPAHSIIVQSRRARERPDPVNGDGFGVGWYDPAIRAEPGVFRSIRPAWSNRNLQSLSRMLRTRHFFAHVRGASEGMEVSELNCHPFDRGRFLFMHNGLVDEFERVRLRLRKVLSDEAYLHVRGTTDSEHIFALFLDRWRAGGERTGGAAIRDALLATFSLVLEVLQELGAGGVSNLNVAVTDGESTVVTRFNVGDEPPPSLYMAAGVAYVEEDGVLHLVAAPSGASGGGGAAGGVFIASERLSDDDLWSPVPPHHAVTVEPDLSVSVEEIRV